jgi:EAL domain-containing protein (putative c-di-GMP-specific phosphodiesterase class I)
MIKIDKSVIGGLGNDTADTAMTAGGIALAKKLDLTVVAEGVETVEQRDILLDLGCGLGQGWLWAAASPAEDIEALLPPPTPE